MFLKIYFCKRPLRILKTKSNNSCRLTKYWSTSNPATLQKTYKNSLLRYKTVRNAISEELKTVSESRVKFFTYGMKVKIQKRVTVVCVKVVNDRTVVKCKETLKI